jgi:uncharacterized protein
MNSIQNGSIQTILEREQTPIYLIHLAPLLIYLFPIVPVGNVIGALVAWLITRDVSPTVDQQGKRALNFQISLSLYFGLAWIIFFVLAILTFGIGLLFLWILFVPLYILQIVTLVMAVIATNQSKIYEYPFAISFLR